MAYYISALCTWYIITCRLNMWWQQVSLFMLFMCLCLTTCQTFNITPCPEEACNKQNYCYTIQQLFDTIHLEMSTVVILNFLPGDYNISAPQSVNIQDIIALSMISASSNTRIICGHFVSFTFINISEVQIENLTFYGCGRSSILPRYPAFNIQQVDSFTVHASVFSYFKGRVIEAQWSNITISRSVFNSSEEILKASLSIITIVDSNFTYNKACNGIINVRKSAVKTSRSIFKYNFVQRIGILQIELSSITINDTTIVNNEAGSWGILVINNSLLEINYGFHFTSNKARLYMIHIYNSEIKINNSSFEYNFVQSIGILVIELSNLTISDTTITNNKADSWGILVVQKSTLESHHGLYFIGNRARLNSFDVQVSKVNFTGDLVFTNNSGTFHF